jgi:hypothetical protein
MKTDMIMHFLQTILDKKLTCVVQHYLWDVCIIHKLFLDSYTSFLESEFKL